MSGKFSGFFFDWGSFWSSIRKSRSYLFFPSGLSGLHWSGIQTGTSSCVPHILQMLNHSHQLPQQRGIPFLYQHEISETHTLIIGILIYKFYILLKNPFPEINVTKLMAWNLFTTFHFFNMKLSNENSVFWTQKMTSELQHSFLFLLLVGCQYACKNHLVYTLEIMTF